MSLSSLCAAPNNAFQRCWPGSLSQRDYFLLSSELEWCLSRLFSPGEALLLTFRVCQASCHCRWDPTKVLGGKEAFFGALQVWSHLSASEVTSWPHGHPSARSVAQPLLDGACFSPPPPATFTAAQCLPGRTTTSGLTGPWQPCWLGCIPLLTSWAPPPPRFFTLYWGHRCLAH